MAAGMEETDIVEFYPQQVDDRASLIATGMGIDSCFLRIGGSRFTRTVYRPLVGPDVLMAQSEVERTYEFTKFLPLSAASSRLNLYNSILECEATITDGRLINDRNSNPGWNWENVADSVSRFVESKGYFIHGMPPEPFSLSACEAFGKLSIMSEAAGWTNIAPIPPIEVRECGKCNGEMTKDDSIALHCQHVFHKQCFLPSLWENNATVCFVCGSDLFLF